MAIFNFPISSIILLCVYAVTLAAVDYEALLNALRDKMLEQERNSCTSSVCQNGGTCIASGNSHLCWCPTNYSGNDCSKKAKVTTDYCEKLHLKETGCQNGGSCVGSEGNSYFCLCPSGYTGNDCSDSIAPTKYAYCKIVADAAPNIKGAVEFRQRGGLGTEIRLNISGLPIDDANRDRFHGVHIHQFGDLSEKCASFAGHWNPYGVNHGDIKNSLDARHLGDLGNHLENEDGTMDEIFSAPSLVLHGPNNIVGHGIVIHEHYDDLGLGGDADSLSNGNAGSRYGCCVVGISDDRFWDY